MTHDASSSAPASAPARPRRSRLQIGCLSAPALLILLALTVGGFEYTAWHGEVDGYTYVAYGAHNQVIAHVVSHDAKAASALRQKINAMPILLPPQGPNMGCTLPLNTPPTHGRELSLHVLFRWSGDRDGREREPDLRRRSCLMWWCDDLAGRYAATAADGNARNSAVMLAC